jgi:hypothetical protein
MNDEASMNLLVGRSNKRSAKDIRVSHIIVLSFLRITSSRDTRRLRSENQ